MTSGDPARSAPPTGRRGPLIATLALAMAAATYLSPALAVLARFIIDELGITRAQLGLVVSAFSALAAVLSPVIGTLADRIGGRRGLALIFGVSAAALFASSLAQGFWALVAAATLGGVAQAAANPATNKLIATHVPPGRRGIVTGLKQSGVQVGVFLTGAALSSVALAYGWRQALAWSALVPLVSLVLVVWAVPPDPPAAPRRRGDHGTRRVPLPPGMVRLAIYAFAMGAAGGALFTYAPLFAQEAVGYPVRTAGLVAAVLGATSFVSRIVWSHLSERRERYARWLAAMAAAAATGTLLFLLAPAWPPLLWVGTVLLGASASAWNSVGMLAVISVSGPAVAGRSSGVVLFGFLAGLAVGPPVLGWTVDLSGRYVPGIVAAAVLFAVAAVTAVGWERAVRRAEGRRAVPR